MGAFGLTKPQESTQGRVSENPWKRRAQVEKATHLTRILTKYRFGKERIDLMDNKDWAVVARAACVNHPSDEVIALVKENFK